MPQRIPYPAHILPLGSQPMPARTGWESTGPERIRRVTRFQPDGYLLPPGVAESPAVPSVSLWENRYSHIVAGPVLTIMIGESGTHSEIPPVVSGWEASYPEKVKRRKAVNPGGQTIAPGAFTTDTPTAPATGWEVESRIPKRHRFSIPGPAVTVTVSPAAAVTQFESIYPDKVLRRKAIQPPGQTWPVGAFTTDESTSGSVWYYFQQMSKT